MDRGRYGDTVKKIFTYSWMLKHERKAMQNHISLHVLFFKKLEI